MARLKSELPQEDYAELEGMMWILRRHHECLTKADKNKLELLYSDFHIDNMIQYHLNH